MSTQSLKSLVQENFRPSVERDGSQWLPQEYGAQHYIALDDHSLCRLLEWVKELEGKVEELEGQVEELEKDKENATKDGACEDCEHLLEKLDAKDLELASLSAQIVELDRRLATAILGKEPKPPAEERNGVKRPQRGEGLKVWEIADTNHSSRADVFKACAEAGIPEKTVKGAWSQWCKFKGVNSKDTSKPARVKTTFVEAAHEAAATAFAPPPPPPAYAPPPPPPAV